MTLGEKIWRLREARGLSQEELAEALGVSRQTVSNWENDRATPDAIKLGLLCKTLGVSADELLALPSSVSGDEDGKKDGERGESGEKAGAQSAKIPKWAVPLIAAAVFAVIAAVGLILCATGVIPSREVASSLVIFTNSTVFYLFLILGVGCAIAALVLFLKKK